MKNKDICDYDPRCIMSSGLMFDHIIKDHIRRIESSHNHTEEHDFVFTQIVSDTIYCLIDLNEICFLQIFENN